MADARHKATPLGASGLKVSKLWLGTMMFGDQTDEAADDALGVALRVRVGGVDRVQPGVARRGDDARRFGFVGLVAEHHRAEPELRDLEAARAERRR